jgi:hypothetical protein
VMYELVVILFSWAAASLEAKDFAYLFKRLEAEEETVVVAGELSADLIGDAQLLSYPAGAVAVETSLISSGKSPSFGLNNRCRNARAVGVELMFEAAAVSACRAFCRFGLDEGELNSSEAGRGEEGTGSKAEISTPLSEEVILRSRMEKANVRMV